MEKERMLLQQIAEIAGKINNHKLHGNNLKFSTSSSFSARPSHASYQLHHLPSSSRSASINPAYIKTRSNKIVRNVVPPKSASEAEREILQEIAKVAGALNKYRTAVDQWIQKKDAKLHPNPKSLSKPRMSLGQWRKSMNLYPSF